MSSSRPSSDWSLSHLEIHHQDMAGSGSQSREVKLPIVNHCQNTTDEKFCVKPLVAIPHTTSIADMLGCTASLSLYDSIQHHKLAPINGAVLSLWAQQIPPSPSWRSLPHNQLTPCAMI
ncbi:uncharacterized protein B0I36DRAFT_29798 [Microdochium trichocladiopsis]|uniref:Uncharacterized protein n=1 Tax=Microdochium trichocladiopsis TaxID=1682393 RepID=A0A9P8XWF1_9PEZI|nr:uncharacterized protein B0I36DRAFT_29798 [Microdochium trichocladiopsis]KAH7021187.1 hypothetical protein B0I36DRAFT_29798 [Microdochium trichocladiopsis]